ncbi:hypothetical protein FGO68_gene11458 [Halteria grandinella]|uniref:DUF726 domain-containing protein n=1 Tax=Halteria grandinella TaxID=5974 RepID=A0A8J8T5H1_HALGN|nr:hypothetical protein FGO68_gene11458 [Halteria grandinella]
MKSCLDIDLIFLSPKCTGEILIVFPGYISEDDIHSKSEWKNAKQKAEAKGKTMVCAKWASKKKLDLGIENLTLAANAGMKFFIKRAISGPALFVLGALDVVQFAAYNINQFNKALERGKVVGQIMGYLMAIGYPFNGMTLSLAGFSLGNHVIHHALLTLNELGCNDLIQNVTFLGGATSFDSTKESLYENVFSNIVAGQIVNVYSEWDQILHLYWIAQSRTAIGKKEIFNQSQRNMIAKNGVVVTTGEMAAADSYRLLNIPIHRVHIRYMSNIALILSKFDFEQ